MLRIGRIEYANCLPLFTALREMYSCSSYEFVAGVPAVLNSLLLSGEVDVCPSSSIEFAKHPHRYAIIPGLSIASAGPVASVLLFSRVPFVQLDGKNVLLSCESATSVNLLKILLSQYGNCSCSYCVAPAGVTTIDANSAALLLIGDAALRASTVRSSAYVYDLGELWFRWTGLPFVFALWLCRKEVADTAAAIQLMTELHQARLHVPAYLDRCVSQAQEVSWMGRERLLSYWKENISYELGERERAGLQLFYTKCREMGLIDGIPPLSFCRTIPVEEG